MSRAPKRAPSGPPPTPPTPPRSGHAPPLLIQLPAASGPTAPAALAPSRQPAVYAPGSFAELLRSVEDHAETKVFWADSTAGPTPRQCYGFVTAADARAVLKQYVTVAVDVKGTSEEGRSNKGVATEAPLPEALRHREFTDGTVGRGEAASSTPSSHLALLWVRSSKYNVSHPLLVRELSMTLWMAAHGAAPAVYGAMVAQLSPPGFGDPKGELLVLTHAATGDGIDLIQPPPLHDRSANFATTTATSLLLAIQRASRAGCLMTDLRLENVLFTEAPADTVVVHLIDFEPDFTFIVDLISPPDRRFNGGLPNTTGASADCVELLNLLFFIGPLIHVYSIPALWASTARIVVRKIYKALRARLIELNENAKKGLCATLRASALHLMSTAPNMAQWGRVLDGPSNDDTLEDFVDRYFQQLFIRSLNTDRLTGMGLNGRASGFLDFEGYGEAARARASLASGSSSGSSYTEPRFIDRMIEYIVAEPEPIVRSHPPSPRP